MSASREAAQRAKELLRTNLDHEQLKSLEMKGGFPVHRGDRIYWIPLRGRPMCAWLRRGVIETYCVHLRKVGYLPVADQALTYLTWIRSEPSMFHRWANVISRTRLAGPLSRGRAIEILARRYERSAPLAPAHRQVRPRLPEFVPPSAATAEELALTRRMARTIRMRIRKEDLTTRLASITGCRPDPAVVEELAARTSVG